MRTIQRMALVLSLGAGVLASTNAWAKRTPPADVPPVVSGNVRYEAPQSSNPCDPNQVGGCVVAYDNTSNTQLWAVQVYCTTIDPHLEADVQWVFISSLALAADNRLLVTNEDGKTFSIDPATQKVTGDTGCSEKSSSGCSLAPGRAERSTFLLVAAIGLVGFVGLRRLRASR